jgi:hypothetical protein
MLRTCVPRRYHELMRTGAWLLAALGTLGAIVALACGSSPGGTTGQHETTSSSGGSGSGSGAVGLDGGVMMVPGFTGVVPCTMAIDGGAAAVGRCQLSMPVSGGLSGTINVPEIGTLCGDSLESSILQEIDWTTGIGNGTSVGATVYFDDDGGVPLDTTGTFPAHVQIGESTNNGGSMLQWTTPVGSCSIVIAGSQCELAARNAMDGGAEYARELSGTGTCSQPATATMGSSAASVTVGSFAFLETIGP